MEWSIEVVRGVPEATLPVDLRADEYDGRAEELLEFLEGASPVASLGVNRYSVRIAVEAAVPEIAVSEGVALVDKAISVAQLPPWPVMMVEAVEWSEFERQLEASTFPELAGISEVATMLGVSRQRASELAQTPAFPVPVARLASGPVWVEPNVRGFIETWERKPGRPKKVKELSEELQQSVAEANRQSDEVEEGDSHSA